MRTRTLVAGVGAVLAMAACVPEGSPFLGNVRESRSVNDAPYDAGVLRVSPGPYTFSGNVGDSDVDVWSFDFGAGGGSATVDCIEGDGVSIRLFDAINTDLCGLVINAPSDLRYFQVQGPADSVSSYKIRVTYPALP